MNTLRLLLATLLLALVTPAVLHATPDSPAAAVPTEYKMIANFKQPFNDDLQEHLSKGWKPVGGVSVTVWNGDLYFAQLIGRAKQGQ